MSGTLYPKRVGRKSAYSSSKPIGREYSDYKTPIEPMYADSIFREDADDDCKYEVCDDIIADSYSDDKYVPEPFQYSLDLVSKDDYIAQMERDIKAFRHSYDKMAMYALRWHFLMKEVEENESVADAFESLMLMRKLCGGKVV